MCGDLVHEGLRVEGEHFLDEHRGAGDSYSWQQVSVTEPPTGGALRTQGDLPSSQDGIEEIRQRGRLGQAEFRRAAGHGEPGGLTRQPKRDLCPRCDCCRGDGKCLITSLRCFKADGDLYDDPTVHVGPPYGPLRSTLY